MHGALTLFRSTGGFLAKAWKLNANGEAEKETAAQLTEGTYDVCEFGTASDLASLIGAVTTKEAVSASLPRNGTTAGRMTTRRRAAAGALTRTKADFALPCAPGFVLLDHDAPLDGEGMDRDALWALLLRCVPELERAGVVWWPSGSSQIWIDSGPQVTGVRGQHFYVLIQDASDGPRLVKLIAQRMWLLGYGSVAVSTAGSLLVRAPVDVAVTDPARLIFCGGAECVPPLQQRRGPPVVLQDGGFFDSRSVPGLTPEELVQYESRIESAKAAKAEEAAQVRAKHRAATIAERLPALLKTGVSAAEAEQRVGETVDAALAGVLLADFVLTVVDDDGRPQFVTVRDVLADRQRWHEARCLDPLNPSHRGGAADAMLFLHGTSPIVYSLDDGGTVYRLRTARQRVSISRGRRGEVVEAVSDALGALPYVFHTSTGPVLLDNGRVLPLTVDRLMNVAGRELTLYTRGPKGDVPTDLPRDLAVLVLAGLTH